ncbi:MAG: NADPH-dependent FMN reductase, partial [Oxalobacteraceae bacterium]
GYYESYAESHEALDRDLALQQEVRNVASAVANAVAEIRACSLSKPDADLHPPRPK